MSAKLVPLLSRHNADTAALDHVAQDFRRAEPIVAGSLSQVFGESEDRFLLNAKSSERADPKRETESYAETDRSIDVFRSGGTFVDQSGDLGQESILEPVYGQGRPFWPRDADMIDRCEEAPALSHEGRAREVGMDDFDAFDDVRRRQGVGAHQALAMIHAAAQRGPKERMRCWSPDRARRSRPSRTRQTASAWPQGSPG
jgi:hypothetical protein